MSYLSGCTKSPSREKQGSHGQYLLHTCLLIQSETQFYYLLCYLLIQAAGANGANSANQIIVYSAPRKQKASFTAHLKPAQNQVEISFPEKKCSVYNSYHHSPHSPVFRKVFFYLEASLGGTLLRFSHLFYFLKADIGFNLQRPHGIEQIRESGTETGGTFVPWAIKREK